MRQSESTEAFSPVTNGFTTTPPVYPCGIPIGDKVSVDGIPKRIANRVHKSHHSYITEPKHNAVVNHGIFLDGELVGAISYGYLLASEPIHGYDSDEYIEVSRVTVANETPNLASCAMTESQKRFADSYAEDNDIGLLVTYVHEDWSGSMFAALKGLGWHHDGHTVEGHQAGNRRHRDIRDVDKDRWVCEL